MGFDRMPHFILMVLLSATLWPAPVHGAAVDRKFLDRHCFECHDAEMKKGGLDLTALRAEVEVATNFNTWVGVFDKVASGEMPPKKKPKPAAAELKSFTNSLHSSLMKVDRARVAKEGRAVERRLNRHEYEDTLRDLLSLPYLEVAAFLPEDTESHGFNKVGEALDVSHVQVARYLTAGEAALRHAMAPQVAMPARTTNRYYAMEQGEFYGAIKLEGPLNRRTFPLVGLEMQKDLMGKDAPRRKTPTADPERRNKESMAVVVSTYEPTEIRFGAFRAPVAGKYRLRFSAYSVWMAPDFSGVTRGRNVEPVSIYADSPPFLLRKLGSFDVGPDPTEGEMEAWLMAGETIRPDAARFFRSRPPDHKNPLAGPEGAPSLAFGWMEVDGPIIEQWPPAGHQVLFGDLPLTGITNATAPSRRSTRKEIPASKVEVTPRDAEKDADRLLRNFMAKAYRTPVREQDVERFSRIIRDSLKGGYTFTDAMVAGYTAVLSSPGFLYFQEKPGRLEDRALADRLSYFLWNSAPDTELRRVAAQGRLHRPAELDKQARRMLEDPRSRRFVDGFLDYWLDLRLIAAVAPDTELYPDYQLDDLLVESMIGETQMFFAELLRGNLGITNLVSSKFAVLNERLARLYGISGVEGVGLRPVELAPDSIRGGLLTQASVLKVTANGTSTSPVKRGAWVMSRVIGRPPPPPPASVPAVEPDTRGATTIREQLALHRNQESCAACHRLIDPAGFAMENFDVMGAWRENYRSLGEGTPVKGIGHNGLNYHFRTGPKVDPTGELPDGREFRDIRGLKQLLVSDREQLARNLVRQLVVYSTGAPIRFADRPEIERILERTKAGGYGVRDLVREIVQSDLFVKK